MMMNEIYAMRRTPYTGVIQLGTAWNYLVSLLARSTCVSIESIEQKKINVPHGARLNVYLLIDV